ncbi:MAG: hypothetical protein XD80_0101 [Synergistales bacterium 53_16]|jgi:hypothetical protein|nr:MAG: hypothetical protein XD80_0101 [Synergistales bacterium 53_16]MDN5335326.1 hypothetical protein [Synergistales bacterium]
MSLTGTKKHRLQGNWSLCVVRFKEIEGRMKRDTGMIVETLGFCYNEGN